MISYLELSYDAGNITENNILSRIEDRSCYLEELIRKERDQNEYIKVMSSMNNENAIEVLNQDGYIDDLIDYIAIKSKQDFSITLIDGNEI